jgi:hypothetical protein
MKRFSSFGIVFATLLVAALVQLPTVVHGGDFTLDSATLAGPLAIEKGKSATYTFSLMGTNAGAIIGTSLLWSVIEEDTLDDEELIHETRFVVSDDATGKWSHTETFELKCTVDCMLMGKDETDDEMAPGMVYVLIEHSLTGSDAGSTNKLEIDCIEMKIPEPSTAILAIPALVGFLGYAVRARRNGRS